ncbi:MAG: hypothetical protein V6Z81_10145 [Parvularculales bacterium]
MKNFLAAFLLAVLAAPAFAVDDIEAILGKADQGYGEYLSGECVTCHHQAGKDEGIPAIQGLDPEVFITVIYSYKNNEIENKVMQLVAGRLDDEQIASLAVYFASLPALE